MLSRGVWAGSGGLSRVLGSRRQTRGLGPPVSAGPRFYPPLAAALRASRWEKLSWAPTACGSGVADYSSLLLSVKS